MRIDLNASAAAAVSFNATAKSKSSNSLGAVGDQQGSSEDTTSLTAGSGAVQTLTQAALQTVPTRAERVAALQQAVATGQYQVDADQTALALTKADL
jgi:flagellar biosynthesis anti-sigma factor FlgM